MKNKTRDNTASLYLRLSRDDNLEGESYSISNQKELLTKVAKEKGYTNLLIYIDDGISGITMQRPDYIRIIEDFENNKSSDLFVKDLSRIGRNYIGVGKLTEEFLPEHDIRLVFASLVWYNIRRKICFAIFGGVAASPLCAAALLTASQKCSCKQAFLLMV